MKYVYIVWSAIALLNCSLESFRVLQSASYRPQRGYYKVLFTWYYLLLVLTAAFCWIWRRYIGIEAILCGVYTLLSVPLVFTRRKTPLKFTRRIVRMLVVDFLLLLVACYFSLYWWALFLPIFALLSWLLCLPVDCIIAGKYLKMAQKKLADANLTVIGITGSYGKTSTKDMLCALLSESISPDGSCNTPLGIAAYINSTDISKAKYLILEFGARKKGDIARLCQLYKPHYGIVTGVCGQHLSTFHTLENILRTKGELTAALPADGLCLLGDESVRSLRSVGACKKACSSVKIINLTVTPKGLRFVAARGKTHADVVLPQITSYSADTFALCATLCMRLGQSFEQTVQNAKYVRQTRHRMEISHNGKFYIIDDSYNASIKGVEGCRAVLTKLEGSKVAILQGIVEGGSQLKQLNVRCGQLLGSVCNVVIVLGKNAKQLKQGAEEAQCKSVFRVKKLRDAVALAQKYLPRDGFLLFQNDLPDVVSI